MAGIARRHAKPAAGLFQILDFLGRLQADLVTGAAAFHAFGHRHRLPVNRGHGFHCRPRQRMFAPFELVNLCLVALAAGVRRRDLRLGDVVGGLVPVPVAIRAPDLHLAMLADAPIRDDARVNSLVALDAGTRGRGCRPHQGCIGQRRRQGTARQEVSEIPKIRFEVHAAHPFGSPTVPSFLRPGGHTFILPRPVRPRAHESKLFAPRRQAGRAPHLICVK